MDKRNTENAEIIPLLPPHTLLASKAVGLLLFFSFLMYSIPFGMFFGIKHVLKGLLNVEAFSSTVWAVIGAVITVNVIITIYAYIGYNEPELDKDGKVIRKHMKDAEIKKKD